MNGSGIGSRNNGMYVSKSVGLGTDVNPSLGAAKRRYKFPTVNLWDFLESQQCEAGRANIREIENKAQDESPKA